jgi:hypothetical protein
MYEVTKDGEVIATVDRLHYVRQQPNGIVINCPEADAQGICVNDVFYHLPWLPRLNGAEDVTINEFSGAAVIAETEAAVDELLMLVGG